MMEENGCISTKNVKVKQIEICVMVQVGFLKCMKKVKIKADRTLHDITWNDLAI